MAGRTLHHTHMGLSRSSAARRARYFGFAVRLGIGPNALATLGCSSAARSRLAYGLHDLARWTGSCRSLCFHLFVLPRLVVMATRA